jgi:hypothetical protein
VTNHYEKENRMEPDASPSVPKPMATLTPAEATLVRSALALAAAYVLERPGPLRQLPGALRAEEFVALRERLGPGRARLEEAALATALSRPTTDRSLTPQENHMPENTAKRERLDVLCPIERKNGGTYWLRLGVAFENRDGSISVYLDALPANGRLQIREPRGQNEGADQAEPERA